MNLNEMIHLVGQIFSTEGRMRQRRETHGDGLLRWNGVLNALYVDHSSHRSMKNMSLEERIARDSLPRRTAEDFSIHVDKYVLAHRRHRINYNEDKPVLGLCTLAASA